MTLKFSDGKSFAEDLAIRFKRQEFVADAHLKQSIREHFDITSPHTVRVVLMAMVECGFLRANGDSWSLVKEAKE